MSIGLFCGMLALSLVPLLRYASTSEERKTAPEAGIPHDRADDPLPPATAVKARVVQPSLDPGRTSGRLPAVGSPDREQQLASLLAEAHHALGAGDTPRAERLFGGVVELDEDNPRAAFGLAQIRLSQGNLAGAEGWIQLALRKRPRRATYHALYADILERMGRLDEAREERQHARVSGDREE